MQQDRKLVKEFDRDGDKILNREERQAARETLKKEREKEANRDFGNINPPAFGPPPGFRRGNQATAKSRIRVTPAEVRSYPRANFYDPKVVRTLFLDFENQDWEAELQDFHDTDVEVPATLMVDGEVPASASTFEGCLPT
jgi:hypothetical protein